MNNPQFTRRGIKGVSSIAGSRTEPSQARGVDVSHLSPGQTLPLVIQPSIRGIKLPIWVKHNVDFIESELLKYGGILFRGFDVRDSSDFGEFVHAFPSPLMRYMEGATPRTQVSENIYTSTEFPPDQSISIHNELCYVTTWPMKIWFCCMQAAEQGGETPIGDVRKVFNRIDPEILSVFREKGWMLVRNFGYGFGPSWQTSYHVSDKAALEDYFNRAAISYEWKDNDRLRTWQVRPAVAQHLKTGEMVWFNHIGFWHVSSLDSHLRKVFLAELGEEGLPYNTYYGDGSRIESSVIDALRQAYDQETIAFPWKQGDILMLDNMMVAHGRNPFSGNRKVLAAMGEPSR